MTTSVITLLIVLIAAVNQGGVKFMVDFTAPVFWLFILLTGIGVIRLALPLPACSAAVQGAALSDSANRVRRHLFVPALSKPDFYVSRIKRSRLRSM